jgi:hypothetical protein
VLEAFDVFFDDSQIHIMILGLSTDTKTPCLDIWENGENKFSKRGGAQNRNPFGAINFNVVIVNTVTLYRIAAPLQFSFSL